jgi:hypothetical protein
VNDEPAVAVEDTAKEEERPADVEVGDVDVLVLVGPRRLVEALTFAGWFSPARREFARRLEDTIDAGGTHSDDVGVEHHVRQPPISLQRVEVTEGEDGHLLLRLQPEITGHECIVLIGGSQSSSPAIELAPCDSQPADQEHYGEFGATGPMADELDDRVTGLLANPGPGQSYPSSFLV